MVDLAGKVAALVGRLASMSHRLAAAEIERLGGSARRGLARGADVAIVGHGSHAILRSGRLGRMLAVSLLSADVNSAAPGRMRV